MRPMPTRGRPPTAVGCGRGHSAAGLGAGVTHGGRHSPQDAAWDHPVRFPELGNCVPCRASRPSVSHPRRRAGRHQGHRLAVVLAVVALLGWRLLIGADEPQQMHLIALHGTRPFASWVGEHSDMSSTSGQS